MPLNSNNGLDESSHVGIFDILDKAQTTDGEADLRGYNMPADVIDWLSVSLKMRPNITKIWLHGCSISDEGFCRLIKDLSDTNIEHISASGNEIKDTGLQEAVKLLNLEHCLHRRIVYLSLRDNLITDASASAIRNLAKLLHVQELNLESNEIGDETMKELSDLLEQESCGLVSLSLHDCRITDAGMCYLARAIKHNTTLKELMLSRNISTSDGYRLVIEAANLAVYTNCSRLHYITLPISSKEDLKQYVIPSIHVEWI